MEWQPIETAPRDGNLVLGAHGNNVDIYRWDDQRHHKNPKPYWRKIRSNGVMDDRFRQPHHWMQLPEAPKESK